MLLVVFFFMFRLAYVIESWDGSGRDGIFRHCIYPEETSEN